MQQQGCAGLAGLALAADLQGGLIEHGSHLGFEQGQGLGDIGGAEHGPLEFLELLVEIGVAGGAGHAWCRALVQQRQGFDAATPLPGEGNHQQD